MQACHPVHTIGKHAHLTIPLIFSFLFDFTAMPTPFYYERFHFLVHLVSLCDHARFCKIQKLAVYNFQSLTKIISCIAFQIQAFSKCSEVIS